MTTRRHLLLSLSALPLLGFGLTLSRAFALAVATSFVGRTLPATTGELVWHPGSPAVLRVGGRERVRCQPS